MRYLVPKVFFEANLLCVLYTDAYSKDSFARLIAFIQKLFSLKTIPFKKYLQRDPKIPQKQIRAFPYLNLVKEIAFRIISKEYMKQNIARSYFSKKFNLQIIKDLDTNAAVFYGINGDCLEILQFLKGKERKTLCVVEQCILPYRLQHEIYKSIPGFDPNEYIDVDEVSYREEQEWKIADLVLAPSSFVEEGLLKLGVQKEKIKVIPYGTDREFFKPIERQSVQGTMKILFVGAVTTRKGILIISEILKGLHIPFECIIAGPVIESFENNFEGLNVKIIGAVDIENVKILYGWADVFLFPTYIEGSANVVYEALASGLVVLTTHNCGSVIDNGVDGFIIDNSKIEKYVEVLCELYNNSHLLNQISANAIKKSFDYDLKSYGERLINIITNEFQNR